MRDRRGSARGGPDLVDAVKTILGKNLNLNFIVDGADLAAMSMRQQFMMGALAVTLIVTLGAAAAQDMASITARSPSSIWLDPSASDQLLASRLNLTNIAKTSPTR